MLLLCAENQALWIGVHIKRLLVLGGMGRFLLCGFDSQLFDSVLELSSARRTECRLWLWFLLFLSLFCRIGVF